MTAMNANALFVGAKIDPSYHQAIILPDVIKGALRNADKKIRRAIRASAELVINSGRAMHYATDRYRGTVQKPPKFEVRFLHQGSTVYQTDIHPAFMPPQQTDLDDGIYVKTSFVSQDEPSLAATKFFELVEGALQPLCDEEGWSLKRKKTCVRVELDKTKHIDLPLYAIPDEEFHTLELCAQDLTGMALNAGPHRMVELFDRFGSLRIPTDRVMLAHREDGWIHSDPRALHDWFNAQVDRYGPQLRRICRYAKGWRDFTFTTGGPSSIALMVCVANTYRLNGVSADDSRDDLAFLEIAESLPELFTNEIENPVLEGAPILNDWEGEEKQTYITYARDLHSTVNGALNGHSNSDITVDRLRSALGERIPYRPDLVKAFPRAPQIMHGVAGAGVSTTPLPSVARTTSG
ncbi:CBASS cGAMP synthase [Leisingera sp. D0M16]|uniref:CBASS cGAMP synthase n=1 Tax=Leisingera coralii TaxID=3351347 RepID=UPI003B785D10